MDKKNHVNGGNKKLLDKFTDSFGIGDALADI